MASTVALVQCGDHRDNQQRILPLCFALQERGWQPVVLTYRRHVGGLFLRHGFDVCPLDEPTSIGAWARATGSLIAESRRRFRAWHVDPAAIVAMEHRRAPGRYDTRAKRQLRRVRLALRFRGLDRVMRRLSPGHVFVWNGCTGEVANALRLMCEGRSVPHGFVERGLLPMSVFVDPEGTGAASGLARRTLEELGNECVPSGADLPSSPPPRRRQLLSKHGLDAECVVFVPLQVERDTNLLLHSEHVKTMGELVARAASGLGDGMVVVVRRHPEEVDEIDLPRHSRVRYIDDGTAEDWCDAADLVVTVNSTVGLSALFRGRPVVALGRALYTNKGLCVEPSDGRVERALRDGAPWEPPPWERVRRFHRVLVGRHTAFDGWTPSVIEACPDTADAGRGPFNAWGIAPEDAAAAWDQALTVARDAPRPLHVWSQLARNETLDLTYRRDREPVDVAALARTVAARLGLDAPPIVSRVPSPDHATLAVCAQTERAVYDERTVLVLDPDGEPHLGWLSSRGFG